MHIKTLIVAVGWSVTLSSIILQVLYSGPALLWYHHVPLVLASFVAGLVIIDVSDVVISYFIVVPLSLSLMTFIMGILPGILGKVRSGLMAVDVVTGMSVNVIMRSTFPTVWILCLLAGILGAGIGERVEIIPKIADVIPESSDAA